MRFATLTAVSVTALFSISHAQGADEALRNAPIIVTTPGPDRSADELIGSATAIDREDILEGLAVSLGDSLRRETGVSSTAFGIATSRPVIRGLGSERVQVLTNGIGVIDVSAASPDHQVTADGIDAERIEILRGPAALAYGGQAIGGVVNVIDGLIAESLPETPFSAEGFGAYNSVAEGTELAGMATFSTGQIVARVSVSDRSFDDYEIPGFAESSRLRALEELEEDDYDDDDHDDEHYEEEETFGTLENSFAETRTLAAGVSWVGDRGFIGVAVRQQTAEYGLPGHSHGHEHEDDDIDTAPVDVVLDEGEEEESPFIDLEQTRFDLRFGYDFGGDVLTDVNGSFSVVDYGHTEFEAPGEPGTVFANEGYEGRLEIGHSVFGFNGAVGLQFLETDFSALGDEAFLSPTESSSLAVFLYETKEWGEGLGLEAGLRAETVERDNVIFGQREFDLFSGSFGLHRHFDGGYFIGGQVSYTERAPNESELFAFGPHLATEQFEVGDAALDKERGLNAEVTARWRGERGALGVSLFATSFSDFIFLAPGEVLIDGVLVDEEDELPVFLFEQDDAGFSGIEVFGEWVIEDGPLGAEWGFDGNVSYVRAELDNGGNVPFIPPLTFNGAVSAEWGAWEVGADVTVAADQDDPGAGQLPTDGYTLFGVRGEVDLSDFGFGRDGTELFAEVRNVTDEEVRFATSVLKDVAPQPGRNARIGLRVVF